MHFVLGLFGGLVGGWLFEQLGITWGGVLGQLGTAIIGAVALLWVVLSFESVASSLQMT
ncbi:MAG: GlsB/YeaQ/YmgE family stress response membrane protein [Prevotella sp.]|nr:GlsB/YeaQ/YmgE family stress response membrane protein [Prevotella sp.]